MKSKHIKLVLSVIFSVTTVSAVLAFKVKSPNVCAYTRTLTTNATTATLPAFTDALLTHSNTIGVVTGSTVGLSTQYATILAKILATVNQQRLQFNLEHYLGNKLSPDAKIIR